MSPQNNMLLTDQLVRLTDLAHQTHELWQPWEKFDRHLNESPRKNSWRRVLSSIASAENLEKLIMQPMLSAYQNDIYVYDYLKGHALDEHRHHFLLVHYLKNSFDFVKSQKTWSDLLLYQSLLPQLVKVFRFFPIAGVIWLRCYEKISLGLYQALKVEAEKEGAINLLELLEGIQKDERRHLAGMDLLIKIHTDNSNLQFAWFESGFAKLMLAYLKFDLNMSFWAIHNQEMQKNLRILKIDPKDFNKIVFEAVEQSRRILNGNGFNA